MDREDTASSGLITIDATKADLQDVFVRLKEILSSKRSCEVTIDVHTRTLQEAKKVSTFVSMSGCTTEVEKKVEYYIIRVRGIPCCV